MLLSKPKSGCRRLRSWLNILYADVGGGGGHIKVEVAVRSSGPKGRAWVPPGVWPRFQHTLKVPRGGCVSRRNTDSAKGIGRQACRRAKWATWPVCICVCQCVCLGRLRAALVWSSNEVCRKTSGSPARQDPLQEVEALLGLAKLKEKPEDKLQTAGAADLS